MRATDVGVEYCFKDIEIGKVLVNGVDCCFMLKPF
jgi:hypothetical protein